MKPRFKKYPEFNKIFEEWYNYFKDMTKEEIENSKAVRHPGSNRDGAFKRGFNGFKIRAGDGSPYLKNSPLYPVYRAGEEIRKLVMKK